MTLAWNAAKGVCWFACALLVTLPAQAPAASEVVLHNFGDPLLPKGANAKASLIRDSAGNLYGTTAHGGTVGAGVVYKLDPMGLETVLYNFTGGADGGTPQAGVTLDAAGNLYGTTLYGGTGGSGVVYMLDTAAHETVLYAFTGGADGAYPEAGVTRDSAGNLYGTTDYGGAGNAGVVYRLDAAGHETILYSFTGGTDGAYPYSSVILDSAGNIYGTTEYGGYGPRNFGAGVVYKLDTTGHETVLHSFKSLADGGYPYAGLTRDSAGNFYGTTSSGGLTYAGVVYKLDAAGHETVLYHFTGGTDGGNPYAGVTLDAAGNVYGTTQLGGLANLGVVYKVDTTGHETVLYSFTGGTDGGDPYAGVILDAAGNLYGTTFLGGPADQGVLYKVGAAGGETVLDAFTGAAGGATPYAGVTRDSAGNLYGATYAGGPANLGVVYKLDTTGHEIVLHNFTRGADGKNSKAGVTFDTAGNLYGTTVAGGPSNAGVVYKLDITGHETELYRFTGGADGGNPNAGVVLDSAGNLYGTAAGGGTAGRGVVYKLDPTGHETVLYSFSGGADGGFLLAGVILDSAGNLYGTAEGDGTPPAYAGTVYKLDPTGHQTVLYNFTGGADGGFPYGGVILDSAGNLYGTTYQGGAAGRGVVYKVDPTGHETVLYSFTGGADGGQPYAGVTLDSAGNLFGTTYYGGTAGAGVVYKLDPTGHETVLYSFTGGADGKYPYAGVILDSAGNLYGTTEYGGQYSGGVVFKLTP